MKISTKFLAIISVTGALIMGFIIFNGSNLREIKEYSNIAISRSQDASQVNYSKRIGDRVYKQIADFIINGYEDNKYKDWESDKVIYLKEIDEINADTEEEKKAKEKTKKDLEKMISIFEEKIIPEIKNKDLLENNINKADAEIDSIILDIENSLSFIEKALEKEQEETSTHLQKHIINANFFNIIFGVTTILAVSIFIILLSKFIIGAIKKAGAVSLDLAEGEGDLTIRLDERSKDEIGDMSKNFNKFLNKITEIISEITGYSNRVASGSEQLSSTMEQIEKSLDVLGNSSTTTAAAVEEMASTTNTVSDNVKELLTNSQNTLELANAGGNAVKNTIEEIHKIKRVVDEGTKEVKSLGNKTNEIGEIVFVINDIAAQTNLLALNAAIEAARAGEAGKGFEVVAEEVRKLAEKTTHSTKEIAKMIKEIQNESNSVIRKMLEVNEEVEVGVEKATHTGKALEEIVNQTESLKDMVNMIASSTKEQALAADEIAKQTENVTNSVEENGRAVEQSSEAIREIADIAEKLNQIVNQFKIANGKQKEKGIKYKS